MIKTNLKKIGVFGGSFDPPHYGHLKISKIALKKLKLKELLWCVTKKNPFKKKTFFSLTKRLNMCEKLIRKNKKIKVQYLEVKIKSSATIDLIKYLKKKHSNTEFFLIIGSDNLISLNKWKNWKQLVKLTKIVVFSRKDYDQKVKKSGIFRKMKKIIFIKNKYINISSTQLRNKLN
tara:strand:- start:2123 stop:2650 length:528 start_codon:yes stop_codon:yes gene_type:complete